ncbi:MAG: hypothetical protein IJ808_07265 [Muribaculaceae bacterium]|nr:hypothetical protein [Muribaculaceae bacterium]
MKRIFFAITLSMMMICTLAQSSSSRSPKYADNPNATFQLFPTQNMWNFIKLNTQTGEMWQVQYSVNDDDSRIGVTLNDLVLIGSTDKKVNGRFTLYPTENMYTFLLLDTIDGRVWQTQSNHRGIIGQIYNF